MEHLQQMTGLFTPEVIKVLAALLVAFVGYKSAAKVIGFVGNVAGKFPLTASSAAVLFIAGLGTMSYGLGTYFEQSPSSAHGPVPISSMSDSDLMKLVKECPSQQQLQEVLTFVRQRDRIADVPTMLKAIKEHGNDNSQAVLAVLNSIDAQRTSDEVTPTAEAIPVEPTVSKRQAAGLSGLGLSMAICGFVIFMNRPQRQYTTA